MLREIVFVKLRKDNKQVTSISVNSFTETGTGVRGQKTARFQHFRTWVRVFVPRIIPETCHTKYVPYRIVSGTGT